LREEIKEKDSLPETQAGFTKERGIMNNDSTASHK